MTLAYVATGEYDNLHIVFKVFGILLLFVAGMWLLAHMVTTGLDNSYGKQKTDGTGCPCCGRDPKLCGYEDWNSLTEEEKEKRRKDNNEQIMNAIL